MKYYLIFIVLTLIYSCSDKPSSKNTSKTNTDQVLNKKSTSLIVLGTIQDAGSPHIGCIKECCKDLFKNPDKDRQVAALGLVDNNYSKKYLFEATPDIARQMKALSRDDIQSKNEMVDGIFLTHAHIGHYAGLMYLGKEATNAKNVTVFGMPRMKRYLETNGPWSQLVSNKNISLTQIEEEQSISLSPNLIVTPFLVPHRDEYSETVGYNIKGPHKTALFIPDIDKWNKWKKSIVEEIKNVDYAFLDATFYSGKEINNRDISEIPHPFMIESLEIFNELDMPNRNKVIFIHLNHTNPTIDINSDEAKKIINQGFNIARINDVYDL
ncbi:MBL fold metallo-hydrolase [Cellulophaga sp. HaHaR_3_176]|uniref:MBL fold metallo-hydrolase n=1 Tax=Cellulophaga sp. HaHaR_3_176 TaxID=1942464 RepID=UPI001C1F8B6D|nr:MBL fold metallo-hydrolase [Cellulophaga sp. HaHaR_3_176]QWX83007.1 MBL fold metallo-hydrolase [Cellulophaga sp. HaHaR_3_176]